MTTFGTLYMLPTLISDNTMRGVIPTWVRERACTIDYFLVEAAKTTRHYLKALNHPKPIASLHIEEIGHEPDPAKINQWLEPLRLGHDVAIVSESGCPGIADPGAQIVARAQREGIRVVPLVGPSSLLLTLMASGLDGQHFRFVGYLPIAPDERRQRLIRLEKESAKGETILCIETPYRNQNLWETMVQTLRPDTRICVAIDVTGRHESIQTKTVTSWKETHQKSPVTLRKRPTVFAFLAQPEVRSHRPSQAPRNPAHFIRKDNKHTTQRSRSRRLGGKAQ